MLRIFFTNKKIREKLKFIVAFLCNRKIAWQLGLLPHPVFLKIVWSKLRESHLDKKAINMQISF